VVLLAGAGALLTAGVLGLRADDKPAAPAPQKPGAAPPLTPAPEGEPSKPAGGSYVLGYTMKDIDGKDVSLEAYKGKVVLIVNVASNCGFTSQYAGLQKLFDEKKEAGLVVLGFPTNDFGRQEPGSEAEIKSFCSTKYNVTFPMFSKVQVKGEGACELYKKLASQPAPIGGEPGWNFTKFLVDRSGNVVSRYDSRVKPDDATLSAKIAELLGGS
jgi:glutathione peroxidase